MAIDSRNSFLYSPLDLTTSTGSATGAATPLASVAASGSAGVFNVAKRVQITYSVSSNGVAVPLLFSLFNGASNTGTVLCSWNVTPQNGSGAGSSTSFPTIFIDADNLHIPGSTANTAMCVSTGANGVANSLSACNLQTYVFPKANAKTVTNAA